MRPLPFLFFRCQYPILASTRALVHCIRPEFFLPRNLPLCCRPECFLPPGQLASTCVSLSVRWCIVDLDLLLACVESSVRILRREASDYQRDQNKITHMYIPLSSITTAQPISKCFALADAFVQYFKF